MVNQVGRYLSFVAINVCICLEKELLLYGLRLKLYTPLLVLHSETNIIIYT